MPVMYTMVYPVAAYVRVEVDWSDTVGARRAAVYRVDCLTGERVPLRPYLSYSGDFLDLSCKYGIFWDTEPQLDRCISYCTQAQDASGNLLTRPADNLATDDFTRNVANGWGAATSGQIYTTAGGAAADYSVNGTKGFITLPSVMVIRQALLPVGQVASGILAKVNVSATATGGPFTARLALAQDANNYYGVFATFTTGGGVTIQLNKLIAGVGSTLGGSASVGTYVTGTQYWIRFEQVVGGMPRAKAWLTTDPEPASWQVVSPTAQSELTTLTQGGLFARAETGNTNVSPIVAFDDLSVYNVCAAPVAVETCSSSIVVPSSGDFYLGDPVRPCNDVILQFNAPVSPDCVPTQGIFFGNMADEAFAANTSSFLPVNAKYPIVANRTRRAVASTLTVATRTFADRDALRRLNQPNSPLLLRGPAQYGIPDRYMSVDDVEEMRPVSDHRVQPRAVTMPHFQMARPSGPSEGVCGTRVVDQCDKYTSWDAVAAAGLSWADLLRGKASSKTPLDINGA